MTRCSTSYITAAKSLQSCPTLCDPMDCSLPGFSVHGILQARTLEWVAISFSNAWKWKVKVKSLSRVRLFATPWTAAYQAPPSMGFSGQTVLEWGAIAFSHMSLGKCKLKQWDDISTYILLLLLSRFSRVRLFATPWTAAYQAPPSMGFSRQEYWSGVPLAQIQNTDRRWYQ